MELLSNNVEQMREYGIALGLNDIEIDLCIYSSLQQQFKTEGTDKGNEESNEGESSETKAEKKEKYEKSNERKPEASICTKLARLSFACVKYICVTGLVLSIASSLFFTLCPGHVQKAVAQTLHPITYDIVRLVRIASLPIIRRIDLTAYHEANCIIPNPFVLLPEVDCRECSEINSLPKLSKVDPDTFREQYINIGKPAVIEDAYKSGEVSLDALKIMYAENKNKFAAGTSRIHSTDPRIDSLHQLMTEFSEMTYITNVEAHTEWHVSGIGPAQALRSVFKRPYFVPRDTEILMDKAVYLDSSKAKPYSLMGSHSPNLWYIQSCGTRHLVLVPRGNCAIECKSFQVTLTSGQALFVPDIFWRVDSLPVTGSSAGAHLSVAFVGNFF